MLFEFDLAKSALTKADLNPRISFDEAQAIWIDQNYIELPLPFTSEPLTAVIGKIGPDLWTAIATQRGENIWIISVRRAHPKEEKSMHKTDSITSQDGRETITAQEFDRRLEAGEDVSQFMDVAKARRPGREVQRVNVDFPKTFLAEIDREADRVGVPRQAWIKTALASALKRLA